MCTEWRCCGMTDQRSESESATTTEHAASINTYVVFGSWCQSIRALCKAASTSVVILSCLIIRMLRLLLTLLIARDESRRWRNCVQRKRWRRAGGRGVGSSVKGKCVVHRHTESVVKRDAVGFVVLLDEHGYRSQDSASFSRVLRGWMTNRGGDQLKSITMQSGTELK